MSLNPVWMHVAELVRVVAVKNMKFVMPNLMHIVRKGEHALFSTGGTEREEDAEEEVGDDVFDGEENDDADVVM